MLKIADRVRQTTTTTGTGTLDLDASIPSGFQGFVAGVGNGNTCYYTVQRESDWEVGIGTVTDAATDTLSRDTVLASSNSGNLVDLSAGIKQVFVTAPAAGTIFNAGTSLVSTRIPYVTTNGMLIDSTNITTDGTTITAGGFSTSGTLGAGASTLSSANIGSNTLVANLTSYAGRVGIGTATPGNLLNVQTSSGAAGTAPVLGTNNGQIRISGYTGLWGFHIGIVDATGLAWMQVMRDNAATAYDMLLQPVGGRVGIGVTAPTAVLHLKAGTATANTAPLKIAAGVNLATPEPGAIESDGTNLYWTNSGSTRGQVALGSEKITFGLLGNLEVGTDQTNHIQVSNTGTITTISAIAKTAPTGADAIFSIKKNGGAEIAALTITAGQTTATATISGAVTAGDYLSIDVTQIGSTIPGADVNITLVTTL